MYLQGDSMESSGVVTSIREPRIPNASNFEGRKKVITPRLGEIEAALPARAPHTREEIVKFQRLAVEIVASKLSEGLSALDARDISDAEEKAKNVKGTWPKAEFLFMLKDAGLFKKALKLFEEVEAFRAVA